MRTEFKQKIHTTAKRRRRKTNEHQALKERKKEGEIQIQVTHPKGREK
jgi:hypothetical protein